MPKGYKKDGSYAGKVFQKGQTPVYKFPKGHGAMGFALNGHKHTEKWKAQASINKTNEKHWAWKGNQVSYSALHSWVKRHKGLPKECVFCGATKTTRNSMEWANIDHKYSRNLDDWFSSCYWCHRFYDKLFN